MVRKAMAVMGKVWRIGKRYFKNDFQTRMVIYRSLVESILMYNVEVRGWKEQEKMENIKIKYVKWTWELDRWTPTYIVNKQS
ncbi:hypothetical protein WN55_03032 [Dufourea novaeangliae]|uniref:Uncharacterized protein n=1 Tax=Dufourea novaeangliae TaxID=178035 RepID=A0A154PHY7_DUFNO|nr:hypothetical protein WN55_03032 [Dufourea novaeangliae]